MEKNYQNFNPFLSDVLLQLVAALRNICYDKTCGIHENHSQIP
jgi:hypothetical protein